MPTLAPGIAELSAMRPLPPLSRMAVALAMTIVVWEQRRRTRTSLTGLDDRMLDDIGLTRHEAWHESQKPFWRS